MVSSRQAIACILLSLGVVACAYAQSAPKEQTSSISGKVTLKNKGVAGVVVVVIQSNYSGSMQRPRHRGTTDDEGNYRISDIPAGNYLAYPLTPALAVDKTEARRLLTIGAGETIRDVDFVMVPGGVITGRITNADGQPLVEEHVSVVPVDSKAYYFAHNLNHIQTDDRGIYRAFGLRPGKYRVSVGQAARGLPYMRQSMRQTFYPSVTEIDKAAVIEVAEGSETVDIDIVATGAYSSFTVSGRVIDSAGKPIPGIILGIEQRDGNSSISSTSGSATNSKGEFKLLNVLPGKYRLFFSPPKDSDLRADALQFEVIDSDLTGLEIKTKKGAVMSGMVVLEGVYEKSVLDALKRLSVFVWFDGPNLDYESASRSVEIGDDGRFRLAGLAAGNAHLNFIYSEESDARQFEIQHVEYNGMIQPGVITIKEGEHVDGVRIVVKHLRLTGAVRGQVKFENGEPSPSARVVVWLTFADPSKAPRASLPSPQVDSRGRFLLEHLAPGTYELRGAVFEPGGKRLTDNGPKQVITVTDNAVTDVTVTIKLKP